MVNMKILDLPLKAKWYEMIESGNKKEEYREIKKYWIGRLAKCGGRNSYEKTGFYCKKAICFSCITRGNGFHPKEYTHGQLAPCLFRGCHAYYINRTAETADHRTRYGYRNIRYS